MAAQIGLPLDCRMGASQGSPCSFCSLRTCCWRVNARVLQSSWLILASPLKCRESSRLGLVRVTLSSQNVASALPPLPGLPSSFRTRSQTFNGPGLLGKWRKVEMCSDLSWPFMTQCSESSCQGCILAVSGEALKFLVGTWTCPVI
jgi:hypothetical protein